MPIISSIAGWFLRKRYHQIALFMDYPFEVQNEVFENLLRRAEDTEWGSKYGYSEINSLKTYQERVPISTYEDIAPYVDRLLKGEHNLLWPSETRWFAKSSGTTNAKSKFIPVTEDSLNDCHYKGGKDMFALYLHKNPDSEFLNGKNIAVAGSSRLAEGNGYYVGDLSAILMSNLPLWAQFTNTPNMQISLMSDWSKKVDMIVENTLQEDIRAISGVPSWMLVILQRALEVSGKRYIHEIWPQFELIIHGGVSFAPYAERFKQILSPKVNYQEVYNASEGFMAIQDSGDSADLLLMLDYGIFYEFIPMTEFGKDKPQVVGLEGVELGVNYAIIISTNAGLWRYMIGDTVIFTNLKPYRIRISGRTKSFINVVGEELIVDNAEQALQQACNKTGAVVEEFHVAPLVANSNNKTCHQWVIEFVKEPADLGFFAEVLDNALKAINSDYEAKRFHNIVLDQIQLHTARQGTFLRWLQSKGKLGGQNKVPRLSPERKVMEELLQIMNSNQ